jgi:molecular chaperone GrpE
MHQPNYEPAASGAETKTAMAKDEEEVVEVVAETVDPSGAETVVISGSAGGDASSESAEKSVDYRELALRTAAEFDNYRKRVARERRDWQRDVLARFLKEFFPAFDDLDRAISESEKIAAPEAVVDGMKIARANLWKTLVGVGVKEIQARDKPFDPQYHEAIAMVPLPNVTPGMVGEILQAGYVIEDFVLRPAKVVVAAAPPAPEVAPIKADAETEA